MNQSLIDLMSISHFLTFFILGVFVKNKYKGALLLGIIWEIFEYIISNNIKIKNFIIENWFVPERYWNDTIQHKFMDILINMIGYQIGNLIKPI
mgnify:CR=1 FL=1